MILRKLLLKNPKAVAVKLRSKLRPLKPMLSRLRPLQPIIFAAHNAGPCQYTFLSNNPFAIRSVPAPD
jgi:hypothetical protein